MKYLEELESGDTFTLDNQHYLLTCDFKKNGSRNCILLDNGQSRWLESNTIVNFNPIYLLDKDNNVIPIKPTKTDNISKS
jgi:hypothetical protein